MRLILAFARAYPVQSLVVLAALLLAAVAEGSGLSVMLPLAATAITGGDPATGLGRYGEAVLAFVTSLGLDPSVGVLLALVVITTIGRSAMRLLADRQIGYTRARMTTGLRQELLESVLASRSDFLIDQPAGRLGNALATEADRAGEAYEYAAMTVAALTQVAAYATLAMLISPGATLAGLLAGGAVAAVTFTLIKRTRRAGRRQTGLYKTLMARFADTLRAIKPLKAMGRESLAAAVLDSETRALNHAFRKEVYSKVLLDSLREPLFATFLAAAIYLMLVAWELPLASIAVLILVLIRLLNKLAKAQRQYQKMVLHESAYWSLKELIDTGRECRERTAGVEPPGLEHAITLHDVCFDRRGETVLDTLSLSFPAGEITVLAGPSGSGKTTVLDLIMGLETPRSGAVRVDGIDLAAIDRKAWRRGIGYVPPDTTLLNDSILANVNLGDPNVSRERAESALAAAGALEFVRHLDAGLASPAGEQGARLSSGQRQRILLARALVHEPRLLVMDEPTSNLDPESERVICERLRALQGRLTIVAASHQPALVEIADHIYTIADGHVRLQPSTDGVDP